MPRAADAIPSRPSSAVPAASLPPVSVVIPCWNAEPWIGRAIESVLDQDYPSLELIVIDDGSTDGSIAAIEAFAPQLILEIQPRRGACAARNRGLALAGADLVLFLDADDYLQGDMIAGLAEAITRENGDFALGPCIVERPDGSRRPIRQFDATASHAFLASRIVRFQFVQTGSALWTRGFLERVGGWDESLHRAQDYFLFLHALAQTPAIAFSATGACFYSQTRPAGRVRHLRTAQSEISVLEGYRRYLPGFEPLLAADDKRILASHIRTVSRELLALGCPAEAEVGFNLFRRLASLAAPEPYRGE